MVRGAEDGTWQPPLGDDCWNCLVANFANFADLAVPADRAVLPDCTEPLDRAALPDCAEPLDRTVLPSSRGLRVFAASRGTCWAIAACRRDPGTPDRGSRRDPRRDGPASSRP